MAQDTGRWQAAVNMVMNYRVSYKEDFLTNAAYC
jgi:hypothetical protein